MGLTIIEAQKELKKVFGLNEFRPHQKSIIEAVLARQDVLAILPTGGGKSLCFQIPALLLPGLTLVITPLISLMVNQVTTLQRHQVAAAAWHSQLTSQAEKLLIEKITQRQLKLLYLSPEKLLSLNCQKVLKTQTISLVVLDEAHCLALWGFDFRPSYLKISQWLKILPIKPQIMALTATATSEVKKIILKKLDLTQPFIFQQSSVRNNISLRVFQRHTPVAKLITIFSLCQKSLNDTILIYCATRVEVETLTKLFKLYQPDTRKILKYHGGLTALERANALTNFLKLSDCLMIATNAFGMGIDKPNIRLIIHSQLPSNLENFVQEIGRASRDGQPAKSVLIVNDFDWEIQLELSAQQSHHLLKMTWLKYYCLSKKCRTKILANYFNEEIPNCGKCDNCLPKKFLPSEKTWHKYQRLLKLKIPYRQNLKLLSLTHPEKLSDLAKFPGVGPIWLKRWGAQTLQILTT